MRVRWENGFLEVETGKQQREGGCPRQEALGGKTTCFLLEHGLRQGSIMEVLGGHTIPGHAGPARELNIV